MINTISSYRNLPVGTCVYRSTHIRNVDDGGKIIPTPRFRFRRHLRSRTRISPVVFNRRTVRYDDNYGTYPSETYGTTRVVVIVAKMNRRRNAPIPVVILSRSLPPPRTNENRSIPAYPILSVTYWKEATSVITRPLKTNVFFFFLPRVGDDRPARLRGARISR